MTDIRRDGAYGSKDSGGGLFRGGYLGSGINATSGADTVQQPTKTPGVPIDAVSRRETMVYFNDFLRIEDIADYVLTEIGTVTDGAIIPAVPNGVLRLTHDTANEGHGSVQFTNSGVANMGAFMTPAAGRIICFETRVSITDVSDGDWFIGFGEIDTTFISLAGALLANGADNHVGFHHLVADAGVPTLSSAGVALANVQSTQLGAGLNYSGNTVSATVSDATYHKYGIRVVGTTSIEFYLDDKLVHVRTSDNAFAEPMTPTFGNIANGTEQAMDIDYVLVTTTR